jgi:acetyltransferase-like isoleucine patch superfamily enzyme
MNKLRRAWSRFWMRYSGLGRRGRMATRLASWGAPPYKARTYLARYGPTGYVDPKATVHHPGLRLARGVFLGEGVLVFQSRDGGNVELESGVHLYGQTIIETGEGGHITIGQDSHIQPRCQFSAYRGSIRIGARVEIAPNCAFYPYDHGYLPDRPIREQPLQTKGGIVIGDDAWLGFGVVVLDGVRIGAGAVIGAGSVVTRDVPDAAIAVGAPARVVGMRNSPGKSTSEKPPALTSA